MELNIRKFVLGQDEEVWVDIVNQARKEDEDFVPEFADEMKVWEKAPWFSTEGKFIAELGGKPVGKVYGHVDKQRKEKKGFLAGPDVVPEFRRKGIGTALAEKAFESLKQRGMKTVQAGTDDKNVAGVRFLESLGFRKVRIFSTMRTNLGDIPHGIGENQTAELALMGKTEDDIKRLNWLDNETFKDHYNFRPETLEEEKFFLESRDKLGVQTYTYLARVDDESAGFLVFGIDPKEVKHLGINRGGLYSLGVLKEFRGRGIAKALTIRGMEHLKSEGMTEAELEVDDLNQTEAMRLYGKLGFKVVKKHLTYLKR